MRWNPAGLFARVPSLLPSTPCTRRLLASSAVLAAALAVTAGRAEAQGCSGPMATPPAGPVCGVGETATTSGGTVTVGAFRGIPYAQPPVGALRWQPTQPWSTRTDTVMPPDSVPVCAQGDKKAPNGVRGQEDCLYLNVWVPPTASPSNPVPVMLFIHGGAFLTGTGGSPLYDGSYLAASGNVVVVTINYRLGALGFLYYPQGGAGGNFGLLDQRMAMTWVNQNIAAFGGDPTKVTIFGESAGAMSVGFHLLTMPSSAGLFRAAIMESNPIGVLYRDSAQAADDGNAFVNTLCRQNGHFFRCPKNLPFLQSLTVDQVMAGQSHYDGIGEVSRLLSGGLPEGLPWTPLVDGTLVTGQPLEGYAANMTPKPYVFGTNQDEGIIFAALAEGASRSAVNPIVYGQILSSVFGGAKGQITGYTSGGSNPYQATGHDSLPPLDATATTIAELLTDLIFNCGNLASADSSLTVSDTTTAPIFAYHFAQPPFFNFYGDTLASCTPATGYVCHAYELPYVFSTFGYVQPLFGNTVQPTQQDTAVARAMGAAWTSFARNPTAPPASGWTRYTANGSVYMWGGASNGKMVSTLPSTSNCTQLWNTIYPIATTVKP
ncbi:MAG TPA: carboxylesterase family protein [Longimicrobium sp.]|nr:carboxylesterase family protein [Longimicrobium sp.]